MQDLKISLVQAELVWENIPANLSHFGELLENISNSDLIILPEMFSTGFSMHTQFAETMDGASVNWMRKKAKEKNCVITGSLMMQENGSFYNRLIWMKPDGNFLIYNKRHLFSYADEHTFYTKGTEKIFPVINGWKILPLICYDLRFPVWSRNTDQYDLLLYAANWPERRIYAWDQLLIARAIENQCYAAGVNRVGNDGNEIYHSGHSAVMNPMGQRISYSENKEDVISATLSADELKTVREKFRFLQDRDEFGIK